MPALSPSLDLVNLACQRGERLLFRGLSQAVPAGTLLRITGHNGVGKTSLLRQLAGLAHREVGDVHWCGAPISASREAFHASMLYLGHAAAIHDLLTPRENLGFLCEASGDTATGIALGEALRRIGLERQDQLPCKVLSQGQRRRVGLARLFLSRHRPLWLLDEPFTALDVEAVAQLAQTIDAHCAEGGIVVFTSHQDVAFRQPVLELDLEAFAA